MAREPRSSFLSLESYMPRLSESQSAPVVLVLDDDEIFRNRLCRAFRERGWDAQGVATCDEALSAAKHLLPDLILVDLRLAEGSGLEAIDHIRQNDPEVAIIMLTGYGSIATAVTATRLGVTDYISKPADAEQILAAYNKSVRQSSVASTAMPSVPSLARVEWEHIQRVLHDCTGNISQAARLLGIHRRSLQRKLEKYPPNR
jgi:two-component system, response regulator RegA